MNQNKTIVTGRQKRYWMAMLFCMVFIFQSFSQYSTKSKKAIKSYEKGLLAKRNRDFDGATAYFESAVATDDKFVEAHSQLASINTLFKNEPKMFKHYQAIFDNTQDNPKYASAWYKLGELHFRKGNYEQALPCFKAVNDKAIEKPVRLGLFIASCEFGKEALKHAHDVELKKLPESINRFQYQSNPVLTGDQETMIYSIRQGHGRAQNEDIVVAEQKDGVWSDPKSISSNINTMYNEGFATISADGKTLVFTSCNRPDAIGGCDLYIAHKMGNEWSESENIGSAINSKAWESGPSLSSDGRGLVFSSERKGGIGRKDLWYSYRNDDGVWMPAKNLGMGINTPFNEVTPFLHNNGTSLFFASDGYPGMGGYDMYLASGESFDFEKPINLGYPLNTSDNEGALFVSSDFEKGYFEKYTQNGMDSYSLLYDFDFPEVLKAKEVCFYVKGEVYDDVTKASIATSFYLYDQDSDSLVQRLTSDPVSGEYLVVLQKNKNYGLIVEREGYLFYSKNFSTKSGIEKEMDIPLTPIQKGKGFVLNNVFFETASAELDLKSKQELDRTVALFKKNGTLKFLVEGHTDNEGTKSGNIMLSKARAQSVVDYLANNGIQKSRMQIKGLGDSKPITTNDTEEGRQQNRRIEIKILD